jgi:hypothetical protein
MRSRLALVAVLAGVCFLLLTAPQPGTEAQSPQEGAAPCAYSAGDLQAATKQVYSFRRWRHPPKRKARRWVAQVGACLPGGTSYVRKHRRLFERHVAYRSVTPFRGWSDEGYWLKWIAIPRWVMSEETERCNALRGLAAGRCRWSIRNPSSGACGPYQFIGHTSCDASSAADKLRHHQTGHDVLHDEGPGAWTPWGG